MNRDCVISEWSCNTLNNRCNNVWNCPNGGDELYCESSKLTALHCDNRGHFCLNISTGEQTCLSIRRAGDDIVDCVGSVDEREFCRTLYPHEHIRRYRCRNANICIPFTKICDCLQDCPENDDETTACHWLNNGNEPSCDRDEFRCRDNTYIAEILGFVRCNVNPASRCDDKEFLALL